MLQVQEERGDQQVQWVLQGPRDQGENLERWVVQERLVYQDPLVLLVHLESEGREVQLDPWVMQDLMVNQDVLVNKDHVESRDYREKGVLQDLQDLQVGFF